jgi:hypothetical protein
MQFKDLLILLRSQDGNAIGELKLGSPASKFMFDKIYRYTYYDAFESIRL